VYSNSATFSKYSSARFEVLTALTKEIIVWGVGPSKLVDPDVGAARSSEMYTTIQQTTRRHIEEDSYLRYTSCLYVILLFILLTGGGDYEHRYYLRPSNASGPRRTTDGRLLVDRGQEVRKGRKTSTVVPLVTEYLTLNQTQSHVCWLRSVLSNKYHKLFSR
jgi:hypothetical protein